MTMSLPSFALLYAMEDMITSDMIVHVLGHQWYWSYELYQYYLTVPKISFDSYMIDNMKEHRSSVLGNTVFGQKFGQPRLLSVDKCLVLPLNKYIKFLVTSADVLHSFAVPGLGIKLDACPGRLVATTTLLIRPGLYFGQCSEICGINHGFMPIVIRVTSMDNWFDWYATQIWFWEKAEEAVVSPEKMEA